MTKRLLSLALALVMILSLGSFSVLAEEDIPEGDEIVPPSGDYEGIHLVALHIEDRCILKVRVSETNTSDSQEE